MKVCVCVCSKRRHSLVGRHPQSDRLVVSASVLHHYSLSCDGDRTQACASAGKQQTADNKCWLPMSKSCMVMDKIPTD